MKKITLFVFIIIVLHLHIINGMDSCENGWHQYGFKCVKYHHDQSGANFHDAVSLCEYAYRATLVTIHSDEEHNFLSKLAFDTHHAKYSIWIGLIRVSNASFVWFDRSEFNYSNWGPNEPNNWQSKNYCVVMSSSSSAKGKWFDVGCTTTYLVMCQKYLQLIPDSENNTDLIESETNMESDVMFNIDEHNNNIDEHNYIDINEFNHIKVLGNVNIVLTSVLFVVLLFIILSNYSHIVFCRKRRVNNTFNSLEDSNSFNI